ncbi:MAG: hypothetical protein R3B47_01460 [Bacteroidia bacterium]
MIAGNVRKDATEDTVAQDVCALDSLIAADKAEELPAAVDNTPPVPEKADYTIIPARRILASRGDAEADTLNENYHLIALYFRYYGCHENTTEKNPVSGVLPVSGYK